MRMYFAAVAPPKPPPTTTTRALDGALAAHPARPASEPAAANPRKSRLFMAYLFCVENHAASASICASVYPLAIWCITVAWRWPSRSARICETM